MLPCPPRGNLPDPEIEPTSPALAGRFFTTVPAFTNCLQKLLILEECSKYENSLGIVSNYEYKYLVKRYSSHSFFEL